MSDAVSSDQHKLILHVVLQSVNTVALIFLGAQAQNNLIKAHELVEANAETFRLLILCFGLDRRHLHVRKLGRSQNALSFDIFGYEFPQEFIRDPVAEHASTLV